VTLDESPLVPSTSTPTVGDPTGDLVRRSRVGTSARTVALALRSSAVRLVVEVPMILLVLPFILATVTTERYGLWATFASLLTLGGLIDAGIRVEVTRRVGAAHGTGDPAALQRAVGEGLTLLVGLAVVIAVGGAALGPVVLGLTFPDGAPVHLGALYGGVLALLCLSVLSGVLFGVLRGLQRPDIEAYGAIAGLLTAGLSSVLLLVAGLGVWALYGAALLSYVVRVVVQYAGVRLLAPGLRLRPARLHRGGRRTTASLTGLALLTQVPEVVNAQWDKLVLSRYAGSENVAQYELGSSLGLQSRALALLPLLPLLAAMSELRERDPAGRDELFERLSRISASIGAVVLLGVAAFAPSFFLAWLGPGYADAAAVARLVALGMLVGLVAAPWVSYALAERWHDAPAASAVLLMAVNAVVTVVLVPRIGLLGAVCGSLAGNLVAVTLLLVVVRRRRRRHWLGPAARPVLLVGALAGVAVLLGSAALTSRPAFVVGVVAFTVTALGLLRLSGDLRPREVADLVRGR
jgi:O-antigen/teichoic acid export membrane protein